MGVIGYGWQGGSNTKDLLRRDEVQYVAVCDVDKQHLGNAKLKVDSTYGNKDCATYSDFRELIGRGDLDAVNIALPDHWHAIPAIEAARAGLDIHGEKPLTHNLAQGRALCDAVKNYSRIWQTGSWQRSVTNFHRACELVRNSFVGKIIRVEVGLGGGFSDYAKTRGQETPGPAPVELDYNRWLGPAPWAPYCPARVHKNWRWHLDYGGGRIMDWVGHHVDIAHWGMDCDYTGPVEIQGAGKVPLTGLWNAHTEYNVDCKYASGIVMNISDKNRGGTKWIGENGWVYVNRGALDAYPKNVLNETIGPDGIRLYKSVDHMQNFLDCMKSRQLTITPCEVAHRSASVGHLALIAIRTGRKIKWDPEKEQIIGDEQAAALLAEPLRSPWHI
jgi:predicted dehydrogenase